MQPLITRRPRIPVSKVYYLLLGLLPASVPVQGQQDSAPYELDSILPIQLNEVILLSTRLERDYLKQAKPLATLDEYLDRGGSVSMVKRGAYAWEPTLNGMNSERLSVTIDGMRIFSACTDKMDPVTSYVDVSNLRQASIASGQQGSEYGNTLGGAIDLKLERSEFGERDLRLDLENGFESNNAQRILGAEASYANRQFYADGDLVYRKADNYRAGGGGEVGFSQFEKYNLSLGAGIALDRYSEVAIHVVYDEARDVGYPALPMDVSLARGVIASIEWRDRAPGFFSERRSRIYANSVTHVMDDSARPDVPIRMDMPGWSDTYGFFSEWRLESKGSDLLVKWDGFYNRSLAEMTMYPANPEESPMFMLTWPDVRTWNSGIFARWSWKREQARWEASGRMSLQGNSVASDIGLNSLRIFYPDMEAAATRLTHNVNLQYERLWSRWQLTLGAGYGQRPPSVSEGYGFYLYNSFDNHDYLGNPGLVNEEALEARASMAWKSERFRFEFSGNYFYLSNYILGFIDSAFSPMTIGADGVKVYEQLDHAIVYNATARVGGRWGKHGGWSGQVSYHRGQMDDGASLPFISPLAYRLSADYSGQGYSGAISLQGAGRQRNFNPDFGEDQTPSYAVVSVDFGKTFRFNGGNRLLAKAGVENVFDTYYSTYSDWANIPRMGRNLYATITYQIH